ncbi:hypothetical protein H0H87_009187 [Tephrocybe sp. NHM501043]|nr:hypothetical protein H0H87_009187 [Tephrocybe sp. NHM501043]
MFSSQKASKEEEIWSMKSHSKNVITLQNPHSLPQASAPAAIVPKLDASSKGEPVKSAASRPAVAGGVSAVKAKAAVPWNVSPYSSGLPGASLTSTSVDPSTTGSAKLLWDEEELMFEDISNPLKGKGKEKDVGKRRAYVRLVTSLGGGSLNVELYCEKVRLFFGAAFYLLTSYKAPKTCYNFLMLAKAGKYDNCLFHRLVPGFMIQTGDPTGTGTGGESYWGTPFRDEHDLKGAAKHDSRGILAMANKGAGTNGSQFYITFKPAPHLDKKHTVFGKLVGGEEVLDLLEKLSLKDGTERPAKSVRITEVVIYQDPFDDYKKRLANKLAKRAQSNAGEKVSSEKKEEDEINWFGVKVGAEKAAIPEDGAGEGIGKYLNLKRPQGSLVTSVGVDESRKKRKTGFGDFTGW